MKIKRTLPPAGAKIHLRGLYQGVKGMNWSGRALVYLENSIKDFLGVKFTFLTISGKSALTIIIQALADLRRRPNVIVPSYTCFSVPAAALRAGASIQICDVAKDSVNYDIPQLLARVNNRTLGIIVPHLFGIPCEISDFAAQARREDAFIIEDCAQALGATVNGRKIGTLGDVAFFSLGRGKNIYAVSGGVIVTDDHRIARAVARRISRLPRPPLRRSLEALLTGLFVYVFSHPLVYWLPSSLPFLELGKTIYPTDFRVERMPGFNAGMASGWASKLHEFNKARRSLSQVYREELAPYGFRFLKEPAVAEAVYPRFPVLARTPLERENIHNFLSEMGMGSSCQYPTGIADIPELKFLEGERRFPNGDLLSRLLFTLPTHSDVSHADVKKIIRIFRENGAVALTNLIPARGKM